MSRFNKPDISNYYPVIATDLHERKSVVDYATTKKDEPTRARPFC